MEVKVSIITIVNNELIYDDFKKNLEQQSMTNYELIKIKNCNNEFNSATRAYNQYAKRAKGKYLVFTHPDIRFLDNNVLVDMISTLESLDNVGIAGIAGAIQGKKNNRIILSNIVHGSKKEQAGIKIIEPREVQTLDECLFIIKSDYFQKHNFIERTSWHLYAVEYCMNTLINGNKVYVIPANVWHLSDGKSLDQFYVKSLIEMSSEYRYKFNTLYTTVRKWPINGFKGYVYLRYYYIKQILKGKWKGK